MERVRFACVVPFDIFLSILPFWEKLDYRMHFLDSFQKRFPIQDQARFPERWKNPLGLHGEREKKRTIQDSLCPQFFFSEKEFGHWARKGGCTRTGSSLFSCCYVGVSLLTQIPLSHIPCWMFCGFFRFRKVEVLNCCLPWPIAMSATKKRKNIFPGCKKSVRIFSMDRQTIIYYVSSCPLRFRNLLLKFDLLIFIFYFNFFCRTFVTYVYSV